MSPDSEHLRRAIRIAMNGRGFVEPNPTVGCVIVKDDRIIGEGIHEKYGTAHAEPNALNSCTESPAGATAYVTLEPCCHTNKQTPPCAPRLIAAKIARVVIGTLDPTPEVNGHGVAMLRSAGITVDRASPEIEAEAKQLIAPFLARLLHRRPYVTLKWAESANGKVAGPRRQRVKITNDASDRVVHELRARCDAIAVGTNTVLNDDPLLTARVGSPARTPLRVVLSNTLKLPLESNLVRSARETPTVIYCSRASLKANEPVASELQSRGVDVIALPDHDGHFSFADVLTDLHARRVTHLLVEPGPTLARYFLSRGQADRVWVFRSPNEIRGDGLAISSAPPFEYPVTGTLDLHGDPLTESLNPRSEVFFAPTPSPDFVLANDLAAAD